MSLSVGPFLLPLFARKESPCSWLGSNPAPKKICRRLMRLSLGWSCKIDCESIYQYCHLRVVVAVVNWMFEDWSSLVRASVCPKNMKINVEFLRNFNGIYR